MPPEKVYIVRVWYDARENGRTYGPFDKRQDAEECVKVLAGRSDVLSALVEEGE
jgi:hypothetical protein